jgi:hypothetical protein
MVDYSGGMNMVDVYIGRSGYEGGFMMAMVKA